MGFATAVLAVVRVFVEGNPSLVTVFVTACATSTAIVVPTTVRSVRWRAARVIVEASQSKGTAIVTLFVPAITIAAMITKQSAKSR